MQEPVTEHPGRDARATEMADKPLVVGVVIQHYPPQLGGAECQAQILVTELVGLGCRVELTTTRHRSDLPPRTSAGLLTIRRLPTPSARWLKLPCNLVTGFFAGLLLAGRVDIVHAHCLSSFVLGAIIAAKLRNRPVILKTCTIGNKGDIAKIHRIDFNRRLWRLYQQADMFVAQTTAVQHELIAEGMASSRVIKIPNMLEEQSVEELQGNRRLLRRTLGLEDRLTVLYVGRLHPDKGLGLLLPHWPDIARRHDAQLLLVGEGPQRAELEAWRSAQGLQASVILAGYQPDPAPYYRSADIFVFPSESEAFGNAIVEAMSHGLAVVTTCVGVVTEWGEEAPITIVDTGDPASLPRVLQQLLADECRRTELGSRAAEFVRGRFNSRVICREYIARYQHLLGRSGDPPAASRMHH